MGIPQVTMETIFAPSSSPFRTTGSCFACAVALDVAMESFSPRAPKTTVAPKLQKQRKMSLVGQVLGPMYGDQQHGEKNKVAVEDRVTLQY